MKPDIFIIDRSHLFLTNVDVSIRCPTRPVQSVTCSFTCHVRNFLSTILFRQYWCLMVTHYKGHFALLDLPSRDWDDAHVCYRGLHVSSTVSLTTLTPTAPGIYPQLTTVTENVKDWCILVYPYFFYRCVYSLYSLHISVIVHVFYACCYFIHCTLMCNVDVRLR